MDKKRPQLSLDELRQVRWLLGGLLILISVATVGTMEVDAWLPATVAAAAVLVALARPDLPARVPALAHRFAFPVIVVLFAWDFYSSAQWLPALIHLDILLLLYRGISYRKKRDDLQLIVLGLFLVMVAGVLTLSLEFAVHILVFTAATLAFLFVIMLTEAMEAGARGVDDQGDRTKRIAPPGRGPPPAWTAVHWRRLGRRVRAVADVRLLALGAGLFVGVLAVSALLFLAIPRFQIDSGLFLDRFLTKHSRSGFSDSIRLGDIVDIEQDNSIALRVDVSDPARIPAMPYWRMVVLDEYREGEFRTSRQLRADLTRSTRMGSFLRGATGAAGSPVAWTFYLESGVSRFLPLGGRFARMQFREAQAVQSLGQLGIVALRSEPVTMTAYRVEGMATDGFQPDRLFAEALRRAQSSAPTGGVGGKGAEDSARPRTGYPLTTLELPDRPVDVAALKRWAGQVTGDGSGGAAGFAVRARRWLTGHHGYSLNVVLPGGDRDHVVAWMESDLPGHCELFAGAFTLLAREAGFPTRIVTGFKGGDWNAYEDYFMVRNSHAHAWCEIYDGRTGWIRVDPTDGSAPVDSGAQGGAEESGMIGRSLDRTWGARLDAVRILWYRRVVSFDQRTQVALIAALQESMSRVGAAAHSLMEDVLGVLRSWGARMGKAWWGLGALGGAIAGTVVGVWWWRRSRGSWVWRVRGWRKEGMDPVRREAGRWLRRLGEAGRGRAECCEVLAELLRLRYGPRATWPPPPLVFRRARRAMRGRLAP